ncbi:CocE/NonD family hydrolase C-terminal non-catalytic domain-containing protein [Mesorhizobium sp.]|uniref:CocE/NonD family hydrolase C-terminal non-catalytic domain-containing protein n=1 Tax=Mesorhizobium sp. TaxID=1871066 RepID=UPI00345CCE2E
MPTGLCLGIGIRLDVSSSDFPRFDINTNTGEAERKAPGTAHAKNMVFMDAGARAR